MWSKSLITWIKQSNMMHLTWLKSWITVQNKDKSIICRRVIDPDALTCFFLSGDDAKMISGCMVELLWSCIWVLVFSCTPTPVWHQNQNMQNYHSRKCKTYIYTHTNIRDTCISGVVSSTESLSHMSCINKHVHKFVIFAGQRQHEAARPTSPGKISSDSLLHSLLQEFSFRGLPNSLQIFVYRPT